jgi:hypothetical protein
MSANKKGNEGQMVPELSLKDETLLMEVFYEKVVPKLQKLQARNGIINCRFIGEHFRHWNIVFKTMGSEFKIVDFEFDENADGMSLKF